MSLLLETICLLHGVPQYLAYHEARMQKQAPNAPKPPKGATSEEACLKGIIEEALKLRGDLPIGKGGLTKCRILYEAEKWNAEKMIANIIFIAYTPAPPKTLQIIEAPHLAYPRKYADRTAIEALLSQKGEADDVLITQNGYLTDTSYCNVAFWNGRVWLTPEVPLLEGTARARLLCAGKVQTAQIHQNDLPKNAKLRLFNAMLDFENGYEAEIIN